MENTKLMDRVPLRKGIETIKQLLHVKYMHSTALSENIWDIKNEFDFKVGNCKKRVEL